MSRSRARRRSGTRQSMSSAKPSGALRLQKILAAAGHASRRGAEMFLRQGRVTVNGQTAKLGDTADPARDAICLDGEPVKAESCEYWIAHKPTGFLTTVRDPSGRPTVLDLLPALRVRLFPVGRLDLDTEGLVLLTNDGPLAHLLLHPRHGSEREYEVTVKGEDVPERIFAELARGVRLEGGRTAPARVGKVTSHPGSGTTTFALTLVEGRKRQIRRALLALRYPVKRLVRVRIGPLRLGRLPRGEARRLSVDELHALRAHVRRLEGLSQRSGGPTAAAGSKWPRKPGTR